MWPERLERADTLAVKKSEICSGTVGRGGKKQIARRIGLSEVAGGKWVIKSFSGIA